MHRLTIAPLATVLSCLPAGAQSPAESAPLPLVEASIAELHAQMASGLLTAEGLLGRYLARIAAYDQTGPVLNSILALNPAALDEAQALDRASQGGAPPGPLFGIPVLLKDNIDALPQPTTAGSLALQQSFPPDDAFLTQKLRAAGAVIVGKTTLTEMANFMALGMPNGYSALGGHGANPYDPRRRPSGASITNTGGSSSGSGISVSANLAAVAIGTETSGSILSPSNANGIVGIKPTLGLVSRDGIVPITADQDTAGPMARTVADAAAVLGVIAGHDANDPATAACLTPGNCFSDYTQFLDRGALRGARIAVPTLRAGTEQNRIVTAAVNTMRAAGATVVSDYNPPRASLGPIAVSYPPQSNQSTVLIFGMKRDLNAYLASLGPTAPMQSLAQIIASNAQNPAAALVYGQSILTACDQYDTTPGSADEQRYLADRQRDLTQSRMALDAVYAGPDGVPGNADDFDAILYAGTNGANINARAGYPSICVPAGFIPRTGLPSTPFGVTFSGPAFSEPRLIALAFAFEQLAGQRQAPVANTPALPTDTIPLALPSVVPFAVGCAGSAGIPQIAHRGIPLAGNSAFGISLSSLRASAPVFAGVSTPTTSVVIFGFCVVRSVFPFPLVLYGTSSPSGDADLDLPLPWDPILIGVTLRIHGGAIDPQGAGLGQISLTEALDIGIGG